MSEPYENTTVEQIEAEIRKSRFEGVDPKTEAFMSKRARTRMMQADIAKSKDEHVKRAYLVGYREGRESGMFFTYVLSGVMFVLISAAAIF